MPKSSSRPRSLTRRSIDLRSSPLCTSSHKNPLSGCCIIPFMYFPKFWNRGTGRAGDVQVEVWGWSDTSEADAANSAASRAKRVAESIASGERGKGYLYGTNPLREPVLEQLGFGVVSRNGYGCEVLNAKSVLFCDIDLDDKPAAQSGGALSSLLVRNATPSPA